MLKKCVVVVVFVVVVVVVLWEEGVLSVVERTVLVAAAINWKAPTVGKEKALLWIVKGVVVAPYFA